MYITKKILRSASSSRGYRADYKGNKAAGKPGFHSDPWGQGQTDRQGKAASLHPRYRPRPGSATPTAALHSLYPGSRVWPSVCVLQG